MTATVPGCFQDLWCTNFAATTTTSSLSRVSAVLAAIILFISCKFCSINRICSHLVQWTTFFPLQTLCYHAHISLILFLRTWTLEERDSTKALSPTQDSLCESNTTHLHQQSPSVNLFNLILKVHAIGHVLKKESTDRTLIINI